MLKFTRIFQRLQKQSHVHVLLFRSVWHDLYSQKLYISITWYDLSSIVIKLSKNHFKVSAVLLIHNTLSVRVMLCVCGSYCTFLMSSSVWISGERPPWTQRNCWFIRAARGKQSNASMQESYTCSEYLILPEGGWRNGDIFQDFKSKHHLEGLKATIPANMQSAPVVTWCVKSENTYGILI